MHLMGLLISWVPLRKEHLSLMVLQWEPQKWISKQTNKQVTEFPRIVRQVQMCNGNTRKIKKEEAQVILKQ